MSKTALVIDMEELLDFYFYRKYAGEVEYDGEYLESGRDYAELVIPHYKIVKDPDNSISALHEVIIEDET